MIGGNIVEPKITHDSYSRYYVEANGLYISATYYGNTTKRDLWGKLIEYYKIDIKDVTVSDTLEGNLMSYEQAVAVASRIKDAKVHKQTTEVTYKVSDEELGGDE